MNTVYCITNRKNGKQYVGVTINSTDARWLSHIRSAGNGSRCHLHRAIRKYGPDSFSIRVLECCRNVRELKAAEVQWITRLDTFGRGGYNETKGGDGSYGLRWKPGVKKQRSEAIRTAMARPEYQRKMAAIRARPEYRRKSTASIRTAMARPEVKHKHAVAIRARWNRPEAKREFAAVIRVMWTRPGYRRKVAAGIRASWARRKKGGSMNFSIQQLSSLIAGRYARVLYGIERVCFDKSVRETLAWFKAELSDPNTSTWVAYDGYPVGFLMAWMHRGVPHVGTIDVLPPWRGCGIAKRLLELTVEYYREKGFKKIALQVHPDNPAQCLYFKLGWRVIRVRNTWYGNKKTNLLWMEKEL